MREKGTEESGGAPRLEEQLARKLVGDTVGVLFQHAATSTDREVPIHSPQGQADVVPSGPGEEGKEGEEEKEGEGKEGSGHDYCGGALQFEKDDAGRDNHVASPPHATYPRSPRQPSGSVALEHRMLL